MIRCRTLRALLALVVALGFAGSNYAQEGSKTKAKSKPKESARDSSTDKDSKPEKGEYKGRLPNNWGKLGLTDEQENQIKAVQIKNHTAIQRLEDELERIFATRKEKAMRAILTKDQLEQLDKFEAEAKKKAADKKAKAKKATDKSKT